MLQRAILNFLFLVTAHASAGQFNYLPATSGAEKEFQTLMNAGNFRQALMAWNSTFAGTAFGQSASGTATLAYALYQNGLPLTALDMVLSTNPARLDSGLLKLWSMELKNSLWIQKGWIQTSGGWRRIHNNESISLKIKNRRDVQVAFTRAQNLPSDNANQKARILWQIATQAPALDQVDSALRALKLIRESGQTVIGADQVSSAYGRILYQKGDLTAAMNEFSQIPKASPLWIESVEERAWTNLRQDNFDKALGESITLLSPALAPLVGPESYYLANLLSLKACDYPRIFKNSDAFKTRQRPRLTGLQELATSGVNKGINQAMERFEQKGVSIEAVGALVDSIPRSTFRDQKFIRFMETRRQWLGEMKKASELAGGGTLGATPALERVSATARVISERLKQLAFQRIRVLAKSELSEFRQILDKMHIIEGEVIHRLAVDDNLKGQRSKLAKLEDDRDALVFPYSSDEVWFDELDNYKARVKDCPTLKGAGL